MCGLTRIDDGFQAESVFWEAIKGRGERGALGIGDEVYEVEEREEVDQAKENFRDTRGKGVW